MASADVHVAQARHNEELARFLLTSPDPPKFSDWAITTAFYSAIHYVEAAFYLCPGVGHTEQVLIHLASGQLKASPHGQREDTLKKLFPKFWTAFRKLRICSECVRYLSSRNGTSVAYLAQGNVQYTTADAEKCINVDLQTVKGIPQLEMYIEIAGTFAASKVAVPSIDNMARIVQLYTNRTMLATNPGIAEKLPPDVRAALIEAMVKAGKWKQ